MSLPKLINQLKQRHPKLTKSQLSAVIGIFVHSVTNALERKRTVEIRSFGKLYLKVFKENFNARNPNTNELIYKPERVRLKFKASKTLKKIINQ